MSTAVRSAKAALVPLAVSLLAAAAAHAEPICSGVASAYAPGEGEFSLTMFEDLYPQDGDLDFNDQTVAWNYVFTLDADGRVDQLQATFDLLSVGASDHNGLALRIPGVPPAAASALALTIQTSQGTRTLQAAPVAGESDLVIALSADVRTLFAQPEEKFINTDPSLAVQAPPVLQLLVTFAPGQGPGPGDAPYDLFLYRPSPLHPALQLQVHKPIFAGTDLFDAALLGTGQDGSKLARNAGLHFVDRSGLPFELEAPGPIAWMQERDSLSLGYPGITAFAAGDYSSDWYDHPDTSSGYLFSAGLGGAPAPAAKLIGTEIVNCIPAAPSGLTAVASTSAPSITLAWDPVGGATSYTLYRGSSPDALAVLTTQVTSPYVDTDLANGATYYYAVAAVDSAGPSELSNVASATTIPGTPTEILFTDQESNSLSMRWPPVGGASSYKLLRDTDPDFGDPVTFTTSNPYYEDDEVQPVTYYYYRLYSVSNEGVSAGYASNGDATIRQILRFTVDAPSTLQSGATISPDLQIKVFATDGYPVATPATITLSTQAGATLSTSGPFTSNSVAGVTIPGLSVTGARGYYVILASADGFSGNGTQPFLLEAGAPDHLAFRTAPPSAASSGAAMGTVAVLIEDSAGNQVNSATNSVQLVLQQGAGALAGGAAEAASGGEADFTPAISAHIGSYNLIAQSSGLDSITSGPIALGAGAPAALQFGSQPGGAQSGVQMAPFTVDVLDAQGNQTSASSSISLALNGSGMSLTGGGSATASGGVASFAPTVTGSSGNFTFTASASGLAPVSSGTLSLTGGSASQLVITQQPPSSAAAGVALSRSVTIALRDAQGNGTNSSAQVTLSLGDASGNPSAAGSIANGSLAASGGTVTFSTASISAAVGTYTLRISSPGLPTVVSSPITLSSGPASRIAFTVQPAASAADNAVMASFTVAVVDAAGNVVTSAPATSVGLTGTSGTGSLTLRNFNVSTATSGGAAGTAVFSSVIPNGKVGSYHFVASSSSFGSANSNNFTLTSGARNSLVFSTQPPSSVTNAQPFSAPVVLSLLDVDGNVCTQFNDSIALTSGGTFTPSTVTLSSGAASFTPTLTGSAGNKSISASDSTSPSYSASSSVFTLVAGAAYKLSIVTASIPSSAASGIQSSPATIVQIVDVSGNPVTSGSYGVGLQLGTVTQYTMANNTGTTSNGQVGIAWTATGNVTQAPNPAITAYMTDSSGIIGGTTSTTVPMHAGAAAALAITTQPPASYTNGNTSFVSLKTVDSAGNTATYNGTATFALASGNPAATLTLVSGTGNFLNGTASPNFTLAGPAGSYSISAGVAGNAFAPITTNVFTLKAGPATRLVFLTSPPASAASGLPMDSFKVEALDSGGNLDTSFANNVSLSVSPAATLSGSYIVTASGGVATLAPTLTGSSNNYQLTAKYGTLTSITSGNIALTQAKQLVFTAVPQAGSSYSVGQNLGAVQVSVEDSSGNVVAFNASITLSISPAGSLGGTVTQVAASGVATFGDLSIGTPGSYKLVATNPNGLTSVTDPGALTITGAASAVAAGYNDSCAIIGGAAQCWGANAGGQLGAGTTAGSTVTPLQVTGLTSNVSAISLGMDADTSCAIQNGAAFCWGAGGNGQMGNNTQTGTNASPVAVSGMASGVSAISVGEQHACAIQNGGAYCWGNNAYGQLGTNNTTTYLLPQPVTGLTANVTAIAAGDTHTCAVQSGIVWCWGRNEAGELANGTTSGSAVANPLPAANSYLGASITQVASGQSYSCALSAAGAVYCWGAGGSGRLGTGSTSGAAVTTPARIITNGATQVSAGSEHACALVNSQPYCWGYEGNGEVGDNTGNATRYAPVAVHSSDAFTSVSAGFTHSCGVTTTGLDCFGFNNCGQLGQATSITQENSPTAVPGFVGH